MLLSCEFNHEHFHFIVYKTVTDTDCGFRIIPSPTKDDITPRNDEEDEENKEKDTQENNDNEIVENGSKAAELDEVNGADDEGAKVKVTEICDTEVTKVKDTEVTDISPGDVLSERYATLLPMITDCNPICLICFLMLFSIKRNLVFNIIFSEISQLFMSC